MKNLIEKIKDKWLTWRTGRDNEGRAFKAWKEKNIAVNARDVTNYFQGYRYVIAVDFNKVCTKFEPMWGMVESEEFLSYMYPHRPLGQNCSFGYFRGDWDKWDHRFHINDIGGIDQMFIATNSGEDAIMIALTWS